VPMTSQRRKRTQENHNATRSSSTTPRALRTIYNVRPMGDSSAITGKSIDMAGESVRNKLASTITVVTAYRAA